MDRLIWIAWRAFWVGLGASGVLIAESLIPQVAATPPKPEPAIVVPAPPAPRPVHKRAQPILSRNPFDAKTGPLARPRGV